MVDVQTASNKHEKGEDKYEKRDINVRAISWFAAAMVVSGVFVHLAVAFLFEVLSRSADRTKNVPYSLAVEENQLTDRERIEKIPPPRLEEFERSQERDIDINPRSEKREKLDRLSRYGWVDQQKGIVHIPIDAAMRIIVEKRLPRSHSAPTGKIEEILHASIPGKEERVK